MGGRQLFRRGCGVCSQRLGLRLQDTPQGVKVQAVQRGSAAELAGLATAPCTVRSMSDAQVRSAQMVENVQRENMSALDEGAGFKAQIDAGDATADQIAERIGKSRSHVYGRIKLLDLCGPLRAALNSGEVGTEVALLLARLRTDKLQAKALQKMRGALVAT